MNKINWENIDDNIDYFSFNYQTLEGKVVEVYDGDTVKVVLPFILENPKSKYKIFQKIFKNRKIVKFYKWTCRLSGIDTPELRTKNTKEKELAYLVRDKLREKILNNVLIIKCGVFDKYGRLLVTLYENQEHLNNNKSINEWLITNNYAKEYDGGKKQEWFS
tara:strand:+ start:118 stop:603 length:486 start_codon:yes stop_codon:yes gene_type:complete